MNYKHLILSSLLLLCTILLVISCGHNSVSEDDGQIPGLYKAIEFTMPGDHDGTVDILDNGGSLTLRLLDDFEVEGHLIIPANIGLGQTDAEINGTFTLNADSVHFNNTDTFLDNDMWLFLVIDNQLRTPEWEGRKGQNVIILKKL